MLIEQVEQTVLLETEFLGTAYTGVPADYEGPCEVSLTGRTSSTIVMPTVNDAENAAKFAVGELGGYHTAHISPAPGVAPTHEDWTYWAFE